jgi:hypothetical protein
VFLFNIALNSINLDQLLLAANVGSFNGEAGTFDDLLLADRSQISTSSEDDISNSSPIGSISFSTLFLAVVLLRLDRLFQQAFPQYDTASMALTASRVHVNDLPKKLNIVYALEESFRLRYKSDYFSTDGKKRPPRYVADRHGRHYITLKVCQIEFKNASQPVFAYLDIDQRSLLDSCRLVDDSKWEGRTILDAISVSRYVWFIWCAGLQSNLRSNQCRWWRRSEVRIIMSITDSTNTRRCLLISDCIWCWSKQSKSNWNSRNHWSFFSPFDNFLEHVPIRLQHQQKFCHRKKSSSDLRLINHNWRSPAASTMARIANSLLNGTPLFIQRFWKVRNNIFSSRARTQSII